MSVSRPQLARLTAGKAVANTALRWPPFFLFELEEAFNAETATLTTILGIAEMAGLITLFAGKHLDAGRERLFMTLSLGLVSLSAILALTGSVTVLAIGLFVLGTGASLYTVGGHTYLSQRVPVARRSRYIGTFEVSWASALLIGAPIISVLLTQFGWRAPFIALAITSGIFMVITARDRDTPIAASPTASSSTTSSKLDVRAWTLIVASASIALTGFATIVIAGTWLEDDFGLSTGSIGALAFAFGAAELTGSTSSAAFADRFGPVRTTQAALVAAVVGLVIMSQAGGSLPLAFVGLFCFFLGFEYSIVTSFSIVSEAAPSARGRALAVNNAVGTLVRGGGAIATGFLYGAYGIGGSVACSVFGAVVALGLLAFSKRRGLQTEVSRSDLDPTLR